MPSLVLITFGGVLAIFLALYWTLVLRHEERITLRLRRRLKTALASGVSRRPLLALDEKQLSSVPYVNRALNRTIAVTSPLRQLLEQANTQTSLNVFLLLSGIFGLAGFLFGSLLTGFRIAGVVAALVWMFVPYWYFSYRRAQRLAAFEERFPEAIDLIARALRAGHAFNTGIGMVADEIPEPVGAEFRLLYDRQNFGMALPEALRSFAERVPILDARFFATAVLTQRDAGGNLSEVLDNLAKVVRERFKVRRQIRVVSAHARVTGWVLVALPPVAAAVFGVVAPDTIRLLLTDPLGVRMVGAAAVLQILGGLSVKKIVDIEY
jgi:tight adherence protein B